MCNWKQCVKELPPIGERVILAKKSLLERPGKSALHTYFCAVLEKPCLTFSEFSPEFYIWCKADLHSNNLPIFDPILYLNNSKNTFLGAEGSAYIPYTVLDFWLQLQPPS